ncbi:unnamed protein product, partial [marine sediment metagenome]
GFITLILHHSKKISNKAEGYTFSFIIFAAIVVMIIGMYSNPEIKNWLYTDIFTSLAIAVMCFAPFYKISGCYRAFRIRNIESLLLVIPGFFLIMHYAPMYEAVIPQIETIATWILDVPAMAGNRGILIGIAIGTISIAVRILLGYEKAYAG